MFSLSAEEVLEQSVQVQWNRLHARSHGKRRSSQVNFLKDLYHPPVRARAEIKDGQTSSRGQDLGVPTAVVQNLKREITELNCRLSALIEEKDQNKRTVREQNSKLFELTKIASVYYKQKQELKELKSSLQTRNVNKRLKKRDSKIDEMRLESRVLKEQNVEFSRRLTETEKTKTNAQKLASHYYTKYRNSKEDTDENEARVEELSETIHELERENDSLKAQIEDLSENKEINTFAGHMYDDRVRQCYIELLSMGVSVGKCEQVVRSVLQSLTEFEVKRLPSKATASKLQVEAQILSEQQALDTILEHSDSTLHTDNTKKRGREYAGFQVSVAGESPVFIDLLELPRDTESVLEALKLSLGNLAANVTENETEKTDVLAKLLFSLKNLMTDRHIVNKKIVSSLEDWRKELLPHIIESANLTVEKKTSLVKMNSLFCCLHVVANMGTEAKKALKQYQDLHISGDDLGPGFNNGNARSYDLVYQVCKALTTGPENLSDQKSGYGQDFSVFMEDHGREVRLVPFLHNRFNILFHDGAATYFHRNDINDFLTGGYISESDQQLNYLLKCILHHIQVDLNLGSCRALGIIDKLITGPLWRNLNVDNLHILDTNTIWEDVINFMRRCTQDSSPLLNQESVFAEELITKDIMYIDLFAPASAEVETHTKQVLQLLCQNMVTLCERQLEDQLSGGCLHNPSSSLRDETLSAPATNVISESAFADLDRSVHHAPQKSTIAKSALSCFQRNKTTAYLRKLSGEKRQKYFTIARQRASIRRKEDRLRYRDVRRRRLEAQRDRRMRKEAKLRRLMLIREQRFKRICTNGGIWNSADQMNGQLESVTGKMKSMQAVKDQISYRIQNTQCDKVLGKYTINKRKLTFEELCSNLKQLISENQNVEFEIPENHVRLPIRPPNPRKRSLKSASTGSKKPRITSPNAASSMETEVMMNAVPSVLSVGAYVAIAFDDEWYPACIEECDSGTRPDCKMKVRFLHRKGDSFFWPNPPDPSDGKAISKVFAFALNIDCRPKNSRLWTVENVKVINEKYTEFKNKFMA